VATGIGVAAIGSDTGGSVRIPANFCGVVGLKPSFGAIPLAGALYLSWSCDHAGPLTRTVSDARVMFEAMAHRGTAHATAPRAARLAVPHDWLASRLAPDVRDAFARLLDRLRAEGVHVESVPTPNLHLAWKHYSPIVRAEAAYVHRAALAAGGEGFSKMTLELLRLGQQVSAQDYIEAIQLREVVRQELRAILRHFDAIALPTAAVMPPARGQTEVEVADGARMSVREAVLGQTLPFNYAALPAITLPFDRIEGLPVGLQLVGEHDADGRLLALSEWLESRIREQGWFEPTPF
ncbi:MAG: amidase, partial [Burkholderiales bacterium]